jgi:hypothetical protein
MQSSDIPNQPVDYSPERRDFFRIEDRIGLEIRKLAPGTAMEEDAFDGDHLESLKAEFRRLDQDVKSQLASLADKDRLLTGLIKSLNGGLSFFSSTPAWQPGDRLAVRMTLPPELFQPRAVARVIEVHPDSSGGARVHTEFARIEDSDRQQIARHVMRWQIRQRQKE